jgi:prophage regulatory protein
MNAIPDRVVRIKTVLDRTGLSRSTLYRKIQEGSFPRQAKLGIHGAGWSEAAINQWIANLFAPRQDEQSQ